MLKLLNPERLLVDRMIASDRKRSGHDTNHGLHRGVSDAARSPAKRRAALAMARGARHQPAVPLRRA